jgi:predicted ATPase with chaperone activity
VAIEKRDRAIFLTGENAKNFNNKLKNIDLSIVYKRDKFIQESREKVKVTKSNGKVTLIVKE